MNCNLMINLALEELSFQQQETIRIKVTKNVNKRDKEERIVEICHEIVGMFVKFSYLEQLGMTLSCPSFRSIVGKLQRLNGPNDA